jgi:hypothetical protein
VPSEAKYTRLWATVRTVRRVLKVVFFGGFGGFKEAEK